MAETKAALTALLVRINAEESSGHPKWYYLDENGEEQGPFDSEQMEKWSSGFPDSLLIRGGSLKDNGWARFSDVNGAELFRSSLREQISRSLRALRQQRDELDLKNPIESAAKQEKLEHSQFLDETD